VKRIATILLLLVALFLLAAPVLAMSSGNYALDWFHPLVGSGGSSSSAQYAAHLTLGQTVIGDQAGGSNRSGLGFWLGRLVDSRILIPVIRK